MNFLGNQRKGPNIHGTKSEKREDFLEGGTYMVYKFKYKCTGQVKHHQTCNGPCPVTIYVSQIFSCVDLGASS